jgi:hypothetical protein
VVKFKTTKQVTDFMYHTFLLPGELGQIRDWGVDCDSNGTFNLKDTATSSWLSIQGYARETEPDIKAMVLSHGEGLFIRVNLSRNTSIEVCIYKAACHSQPESDLFCGSLPGLVHDI